MVCFKKSEKVYNPYSFRNIIRVTRSRRRTLAGHVVHLGGGGSGGVNSAFLWADMNGRNSFVGIGADGRIILKLVFKWWAGGHALE
jgi:hypothetical protein